MSTRFIARMAAIVQSTGGKYNADDWGTSTLWPGDRVWGGVPFPTSFFLDWATVAEYSQPGVSHALWDALQVSPYNGTVRGGVAEYEVVVAVSVPSGRCIRNPQYGSGGGFQYIIDKPEMVLRRTGLEIGFADSVNGLAPSML